VKDERIDFKLVTNAPTRKFLIPCSPDSMRAVKIRGRNQSIISSCGMKLDKK